MLNLILNAIWIPYWGQPVTISTTIAEALVWAYKFGF
ncbi:MAG: hypothetical protein ACLR13_02610 [Acutalibacteraceae bacterium]